MKTPTALIAATVAIVAARADITAGWPRSAEGIYRDGWIDFNKNGVKDLYEDSSASVEARVADLLSKMTLEEKTCQLATLYADYIGDDAEVTFARGCTTADATWAESEIYTSPLTKEESDEIAAAVAAAKEADLVVAVVGEDVFTTGESRSRTSLDLPGRQRLLVERLFETGRPVVIVLVNGQPLTVAWMDRRANAILETWFAGPFGGDAVAKMLFGEINPSGKTTVTFPKSMRSWSARQARTSG